MHESFQSEYWVHNHICVIRFYVGLKKIHLICRWISFHFWYFLRMFPSSIRFVHSFISFDEFMIEVFEQPALSIDFILHHNHSWIIILCLNNIFNNITTTAIITDIYFHYSEHFFVFVFPISDSKGSSETPRNTSRRCIIMLVLLFGFLVFQFYSASIVGSLLMVKPKTIKTLRNLIDSPLDVGIEDIVYNKDFFKVSKKSGIWHVLLLHVDF